jgi:HD superfamily phosphohydrolase
MYEDVYYHKTTRCVECILKQIFVRVSELSKKRGSRSSTRIRIYKKNAGRRDNREDKSKSRGYTSN